MNAFSISSFITGILSVALAAFVFFRNKNFKLNRIWALVSFCTAFWSFGLTGVTFFENFELAYISQVILDISGIFIPVLFLNFVVRLVKCVDKYKFILKISYFFAIFLSIFSFSKYFKKGFISVFDFKYWINPGDLYFLFPVFFILLASIAIFVLINSSKKTKGIHKQQINYVLYSAFFGFGGGIFNFLPQFSQIYPIGNYLVGLYILSITYAIAKYRLMNIRSVVTRSILYAVLIGTVASFFAFTIFWLAPKFGGDTRNGRIISTILSSILIVVFLDPIKRAWAKLTDRIFYKDKVDYAKVLQKASYIVAKEIDLQKLLHDLSILLSEELKLKKVKIFMPKNGRFVLVASSQQVNQTLALSEEVTLYFEKHKDIVVTEELFRQKDEEKSLEKQNELDKITEELEKIGSEVTVPIIESSNINALFVLSRKMSGDIFGNEDINFFNLLAPQIATAIEKSRLYEEVQELAKNLQKKVDEKTESLRQSNLSLEARNRYLTTMQAIINMISRTLDLKKVTQMIADSIASQLGYIGGVLSFVNGDNKLRVKAVTHNTQADAAINMLPEDIKSYNSELKEEYNFGAKTVLSGRIIFSDKMTDFFSPPVNKQIVGNIQIKLGVKTIVGVPIFSEDKIIGLIHFLLPIEREQISSLDIEMMTALTNQVGIVSRNLELYENLQQVNTDLQDANVHLKALDKAKSEFLSIASHQLRTPVSALKGYLSMMLEGDFGPLPESIKKLIADLFDSASRLARVINIFLNVSRIEAGRLKLEKKPMQIVELVNGVVTELSSSVKNKGLVLTYEQAKENMPLVYADGDKLREVVLNLIDNAIKYTPKGSIQVRTEIKGDNLEFSSQDTGVGIDPVEAQSLFRKFVRGDGAAQINTGGSGLGLFIAQKIVREHDGKIWVESAGKGKGSTFKFSVPLATKEQLAQNT